MDSQKQTSNHSQTNKPQLKDYQETIILVVLLLVAIGFLIWSLHAYQANFLDSLR